MLCGVVDAGSNTIRLSVYEWTGEELRLLLDKKTMAGLAAYAQGGFMEKKGIETARDVIDSYVRILKSFGIDHYFVFATAAVRSVKNTAEIIQAVREKSGVELDVITGETEARLDFAGAASGIAGLTSGLLVDIGGGSTELAEYRDGELISGYSMPIGSLSLYSRRVSHLLPVSGEREKMRGDVLVELWQVGLRKRIPVICGVGGSIRAALKLHKDATGEENMTVKDVKMLLREYKKPTKEDLHTLLRVVPDRVHTIVPGLIILRTVAEYFGAKDIVVSARGVREGYLLDKLQKDGK